MKSNKIRKAAGAAAVILFSMGAMKAMAEEGAEAGTGPNPFSDCGIGAALFPETKWAAVTSNIIWDVGTTAVISATASPETCSGKQVEAARFISETYANLFEETARGSGEYLTTVLDIYGCSSEARSNIALDVRSRIAPVVSRSDFAELSGREKAELYYQQVNSVVTGRYASACSV